MLCGHTIRLSTQHWYLPVKVTFYCKSRLYLWWQCYLNANIGGHVGSPLAHVPWRHRSSRPRQAYESFCTTSKTWHFLFSNGKHVKFDIREFDIFVNGHRRFPVRGGVCKKKSLLPVNINVAWTAESCVHPTFLFAGKSDFSRKSSLWRQIFDVRSEKCRIYECQIWHFSCSKTKNVTS